MLGSEEDNGEAVSEEPDGVSLHARYCTGDTIKERWMKEGRGT